MSKHIVGHNRPISRSVHTGVYAAMVGLLLLFVISAWAFFGGVQYAGLALAVVTGFFVIAAGIPFLLWLTWRHHAEAGQTSDADSTALRDWMSGALETDAGRRKAMDAAVEFLLPIAAVAFGLTAIGIIYYIAEVESGLV
jgi:hypothetical protein